MKSIQDYLLANCTSLKTLEYNTRCQPTTIGKYAFWGCTSLTSSDIHYPESVTTIDEGAFSKCTSLLGYTIPDHVVTVGAYAFQNCEKLANLVIKPSVTSIGNYAFNGCTALAHLTIEESEVALSLGYNYYNSASSSYLGKGLFNDCPLSGVFIGRPLSYSTAKNQGYSPFAYVSTLEKAHFGNPVKSIQDFLLANCTSLKTLQYNSRCQPTTIGKYAFWGCTALTSSDINYPESVTTIGEGAFKKCTSLLGYTIPDHVVTVGAYAFQDCEKLANVVVKPSVTSIGNCAFNGCTALAHLTIEESEIALSLGCHTYSEYSSNLGKGLFYDCPLSGVFIGRPLSYNTAKNYGYSPFAYVSTLEKAHFGNPVKSIQDFLLANCTSLKTLQYNSRCQPTTIGKYAFWGCTALTSSDINYPESVTTIGEGAFKKCTSLVEFTIPAHVTNVGNYAFQECEKLAYLTIDESEIALSLGFHTYSEYSSNLGKGLFYDCPLIGVFIGRPLSYNTAKNYGYSPFANIETIEIVRFGGQLKSVQDYLFMGCKSLHTMTFYNRCEPTAIGKYAFWGCSSLKSAAINYPESVKTIGEGAFGYCTSLLFYTIPDHVTTVGDYAFQGCEKLQIVSVMPSVTSIGNGAFNGCTALAQLTIEEGEETLSLGCHTYSEYSSNLGKGLFKDCPLNSVFIGRPLSFNTAKNHGYSPFAYNATLEKARLGEHVTTVYPFLFAECTAFTNLYYDINCHPTSIGKYAFSGCKKLVNVDEILVGSLVTICEAAFLNCSGLEEVWIPGSITTIENYAFNGCTSLNFLSLEESEETLSLGCHTYSEYSSNLGKGLFKDCPLNSVFIGRPLSYSSAKNYGYSPFANNVNITTAQLGKEVRLVWESLFNGCTSFNSLEFEDGCYIKEIRNYAFYGCKSIIHGDDVMPGMVKTIGEGAFQGCAKMEDVTIPATVTTIGKYGFSGCEKLVDVTSMALTPPQITKDCFSTETYSKATLNVVKKKEDAYKQATGWKEFSRIVGSMIANVRGDVNGDGNINIADINKLIDYILSGNIDSDALERGDVNGDGSINIADINAVIQLILGPGTN